MEQASEEDLQEEQDEIGYYRLHKKIVSKSHMTSGHGEIKIFTSVGILVQKLHLSTSKL